MTTTFPYKIHFLPPQQAQGFGAILGLNDVGIPQLPQHVPDDAPHRGKVVYGKNFHVLVRHCLLPLAHVRAPALSKVIPGGAR